MTLFIAVGLARVHDSQPIFQPAGVLYRRVSFMLTVKMKAIDRHKMGSVFSREILGCGISQRYFNAHVDKS